MHQVDKGLYDLVYYYKGNMYKIRMRIRRGPPPNLSVYNSKEQDITDSIQPYLGPNGVFEYQCTPHDFGEEQMYLEEGATRRYVSEFESLC